MKYIGRAYTLADVLRLCKDLNPELKLNFNGKDLKPGVDLWLDETTNEILFL